MIESAARGAASARAAVERHGESSSRPVSLASGFRRSAEIVEMRADVRPAFPDNLPRLVKRRRRDHLSQRLLSSRLFAAPTFASALRGDRAARREKPSREGHRIEIVVDGAELMQLAAHARRRWRRSNTATRRSPPRSTGISWPARPARGDARCSPKGDRIESSRHAEKEAER